MHYCLKHDIYWYVWINCELKDYYNTALCAFMPIVQNNQVLHFHVESSTIV